MQPSFRLWFRTLAVAFTCLIVLVPQYGTTQDEYDTEMFRGLAWRNVAPSLDGRATTAVGVPTDPKIYYMGATGRGVWQTEDAGRTWRNISDGFFKVGSIGDITVHRGNPATIYVGTGEAPVRASWRWIPTTPACYSRHP